MLEVGSALPTSHSDAPPREVFAPIAPTVPLCSGEPYARDELLPELFASTVAQHGTRSTVEWTQVTGSTSTWRTQPSRPSTKRKCRQMKPPT